MHDDTDLHTRFDRLVSAYGRLVRGVVVRMAGARAERLADDVEQEVLLALWKQVRSGREIGHPAAYLYQAAVRETIRTVRRLRDPLHVDVTSVDGPVAPGADPATLLQGRAVETRVRAALDELPADRRAAAEAHIAGLSFEEIMSVTGWSYNRTRNLVSRGMTQLRRRLRDLEA
jgi:RNA polymerase sigma-70 factor (ECF subfamily)